MYQPILSIEEGRSNEPGWFSEKYPSNLGKIFLLKVEGFYFPVKYDFDEEYQRSKITIYFTEPEVLVSEEESDFEVGSNGGNAGPEISLLYYRYNLKSLYQDIGISKDMDSKTK